MEPNEYALMDRVDETMWWYRALHRRLVLSLNGVRGQVLDAGCGTGGFLRRLSIDRPDLSTIAVDISESAARRAAVKSGTPAACASITALPFRKASFDAVVAADVLCHVAVDPAAALGEFARILRPGGRLILNMPAHEWLRSAHDARVHTARRSTRGSLRRLLIDAGFKDVRAAHWNSLLLPLMIIERRVLARGPHAGSDVKPFHPVADALLFGVTEIERRLPLPLPAGGSIMALACAP